jgi:hypothetical protein
VLLSLGSVLGAGRQSTVQGSSGRFCFLYWVLPSLGSVLGAGRRSVVQGRCGRFLLSKRYQTAGQSKRRIPSKSSHLNVVLGSSSQKAKLSELMVRSKYTVSPL